MVGHTFKNTFAFLGSTSSRSPDLLSYVPNRCQILVLERTCTQCVIAKQASGCFKSLLTTAIHRVSISEAPLKSMELWPWQMWASFKMHALPSPKKSLGSSWLPLRQHFCNLLSISLMPSAVLVLFIKPLLWAWGCTSSVNRVSIQHLVISGGIWLFVIIMIWQLTSEDAMFLRFTDVCF